MKKMLAVGLACMMVLAPAASVSAAELPATCHIGGCNLGDCFKDTDCDGICGDHYFVDEDGDGICDLHCYLDGDCDGICDYFVDADEDGICDHCHDHGRPVQADSSVGSSSTTNSNTTYYSGHHGGCHGRRGGHHRGHC
ncbi:MAG: hypothetical protein K2G51_04150 [Lachnospiraceae bacterium]|nr:hypothetical protein [Lachnospiraceae bacterium]MDE7274574.1 hypothetical protein [Lachnospiraceae bacterium]